MRLRFLAPVAGLLLTVGCGVGIAHSPHGASPAGAPSAAPLHAAAAATARHLEYVFVDGAIYVYDVDHGERLVHRLPLPGITEIRGAAADIPRHVLYISHGGDGGSNGDGSLAAYDLLRHRIIWDRAYRHGIDSLAVSRDGARVYLPHGELSSDGRWSVVNAATGAEEGELTGGRGPHNTIVAASGRWVYLGGRANSNAFLDVASTRSDRVVRRIGPLLGGVRPFTIDARERFAFTTATGFLGFQVSSIASGRVLYTVDLSRRFRYDPGRWPLTAPSHGISLSPDGRTVWVLDTPNAYVHVFDITGLPAQAPRPVADVRLPDSFTGEQRHCSVDCERDGWVQHSLSGCYVFVGDSGWAISTRTMRPARYLPALRDSRVSLEIDWRGGRPLATSTRAGLGYRTAPAKPSCSS